jgi:hypothetical protein
MRLTKEIIQDLKNLEDSEKYPNTNELSILEMYLIRKIKLINKINSNRGDI